MLINKMITNKEIKKDVNQIIDYVDACDFESIYKVLTDRINAFDDYKRILNKLDNSIISLIMKRAIEDYNCNMATLLYTNNRSTHNLEQEYFALIKGSKSYANIFKVINYLIKEYKNSTKHKDKYASKIETFADYLNKNYEDLKYAMFETCNKNFEHGFIDMLDLICHILPKELDNSKFNELYQNLSIDFVGITDNYYN